MLRSFQILNFICLLHIWTSNYISKIINNNTNFLADISDLFFINLYGNN